MPMSNSEARKREERRHAPSYFVGEDAAGDVYVWKWNGDRPLPVLNRRDVSDEDLWDLLVAAIEDQDAAYQVMLANARRRAALFADSERRAAEVHG